MRCSGGVDGVSWTRRVIGCALDDELHGYWHGNLDYACGGVFPSELVVIGGFFLLDFLEDGDALGGALSVGVWLGVSRSVLEHCLHAEPKEEHEDEG